MAKTQGPNLEILGICAHALGPLGDELVFLGGCATALLITDAASPPVRVTRDVDVIAEVATTAEYHKLKRRLRVRGFEVDSSKDAPIVGGLVTESCWMLCRPMNGFWVSEISGTAVRSLPQLRTGFPAVRESG